MKKQVYAVSPVIATLMLVLVSVGSAGVFYVWQSNWQESTTDSVQDTEIKGELTLGGSSTVYPVSVAAAEAFMDDFPQYKVQVKAGGSDTGIMGAGEGILDIGAASKDVSNEYFAKYPDLVQITVGYDGVVPIVNDENPHELFSINETTLAAIYAMNGGLMEECDDDVAAWAEALDDDNNDYINWSEVPKYAGNTTAFCEGDDPVIVTERTGKSSGTEECFGEKLLGKSLGGKQFQLSGEYAKDAQNNQGIIDIFEADTTDNLLGFMSFGLTGGSASRAGKTWCDVVPFAPHGGVTTTFTNESIAEDEITVAGLPTFGEIATNTWTGSRSLNYITDGYPTGLEKKFIDYVLWTENNMDFCEAGDYVSLYEAGEEGNTIYTDSAE